MENNKSGVTHTRITIKSRELIKQITKIVAVKSKGEVLTAPLALEYALKEYIEANKEV